jgi:hypothetical protein
MSQDPGGSPGNTGGQTAASRNRDFAQRIREPDSSPGRIDPRQRVEGVAGLGQEAWRHGCRTARWRIDADPTGV